MALEDVIDGIQDFSSEQERPRVNYFKSFIFGSSYQLEQGLRTRLDNITRKLAGDPEDTNRQLAALLIVLQPHSNSDTDGYNLRVDGVPFEFSADDDIKAIEDLKALLNDPVNYYKYESGSPLNNIKPNAFLKQHLRHIACHHVLDTVDKIVTSELFNERHPKHVTALKQDISAAKTTVNQLSVLNHASAATKSVIKYSTSMSTASGPLIYASSLFLSTVSVALGATMLSTPAAPLGIVLIVGGVANGLCMTALFLAQNSGSMKQVFNNLRPAFHAVPLANLRAKLQLTKSMNASEGDETENNDTDAGNNDTVNMVKHGMFAVASAAVAEKDRQESKSLAKNLEPGLGLIHKGLKALDEIESPTGLFDDAFPPYMIPGL